MPLTAPVVGCFRCSQPDHCVAGETDSIKLKIDVMTFQYNDLSVVPVSGIFVSVSEPDGEDPGATRIIIIIQSGVIFFRGASAKSSSIRIKSEGLI